MTILTYKCLNMIVRKLVTKAVLYCNILPFKQIWIPFFINSRIQIRIRILKRSDLDLV